MATRKQKHAQAVARREALEAELRESGLKAQAADKARREAEHRAAWKNNHDKNHFKFVDECPLCDDIKKAQRSNVTKHAIAKMPKPKPTTRREQQERANQRRIDGEEGILLTRREEIPDNASMEMECI